jgi:hypothetical protein
MQGACNRTMVVHPFGFVASGGPARRPGPTCHVTGAPVTACKETAPPLTPMLRLLDCGTSAAAQGSPTRDPTVPIKCSDHGSLSRGDRHDSRYDQRRAGSNCSNRRAEAAIQSPTSLHPLPQHKNDALVFCSSNGSRTRNRRPANRPSRRINSLQGKRHLRQAKRAPFRLRHDNHVIKGVPPYLNLYPFPFPLSLSLATGTGKGDIAKRILLGEGNGPRALLLIRGSKVAPFGVRQPPQSTRAPSPLLIRGSKAGPSEGFDSRPRARRVRDDPGYVCYMAEARATLPRYPRTFPRPAGTICNGIPP